MKRIFTIIFALVSLVGLGWMTSGCAEIPEIETELVLDRCLTPTNLVSTSHGEYVVLSWSSSRGSTSYVVELYSDEADPDNSTVTMMDEITSTTCTFGGLEIDRTLYARVKGVSESIADSHWATFNAFDTYSARESVADLTVGDRTSTSVQLIWTPDVTGEADDDGGVNAIRVALASDPATVVNTFEVTAAQAIAGNVTVTDLQSGQKYIFTVHYGNAPRGSVSAYTIHDLSQAKTVNNSGELVSALNDGVTEIYLSYAGSPYDLGYSETAADGVTTTLSLSAINHPIAIYGEENQGNPGEFPVVYSNLSIAEGCTSIVLENIAFDGESYSTQHLISFGGGITTPVNEVTIRNCTFTGFMRGFAYAGSNPVSIGAFTIDDVIISDTQGSGGEMIGFRGTGSSISSFTITNSTFTDGCRELLRINDADGGYTVGTMNISNNTFNNLCTFSGGGLFYACPQPGTFTFANNLILNMSAANYPSGGTVWGRNNHTPVPTSTSSNWYYDIGVNFFEAASSSAAKFTQDLAVADGGGIATDDPCATSLGGDFHVTDPAVYAASAGDPRWLVPDYMAPAEDLTLNAVTAPHIWDFTDGSVYYANADKDMVRGDIRFYVSANPVNIDTEKGSLYFTAAGSMGATEPTDCAIGFKVSQPGSVVISTSPFASAPEAHATVSLDGVHVGAVPVDVDQYTVTLSDIEAGTEHMVYIYGCDPFYITYLQWSDYIGGGDTQLAAPEVTASATSVSALSSDPVILTWEAVANAGSYDVMNGETLLATVTEPTWSLVPSQYAPGIYSITVIARPASTDTIREASEPSETVTLDLYETLSPVSTTATTSWASADFEWMNALTGSNGGNVTPTWTSYVHNNLMHYAGNTIRYNVDDAGNYYWQFPGTSNNPPTRRYLSFIAGGPGKLTVSMKSATSGAKGRILYAMTGLAAPNGTVSATEHEAGDDIVAVEWIFNDLSSGDYVTIFANQGIRIYSITWEPGQHAAAGQLETPSVTIDNPTVAEGTESVTVSWGAVTDAVSYDVTVDGGTAVNVSGTSYTLPLTGLALGEHIVSVVAKAAAGGVDSYAGSATLTIVAPGGLLPVSSTQATTWGSEEFYSLYEQRTEATVALGSNFNITKDYVVSNILFDSNNTHRVGGSEGSYYYQFPGSSIASGTPSNYSRRYMRFLASGNGTLTINARAAGSGDRSLYVAVGGDATAQGGGTVIDKDGNTSTDGTGAGQVTNPSSGSFGDLTWNVKATNGQVVTIFADNGIRIASITWTPAQ